MKIVFATDFYFPSVGGIEITTRRLAQELSSQGNEVYIITPSFEYKDSYTLENGVKVFRLRSVPLPMEKYVGYSPRFLSKRNVFGVLKRINPDVIHIQTNLHLARLVSKYASQFKVPVLVTGHFIPEETLTYFKLHGLFKSVFEKMLLKLYINFWVNADVLTTPSYTAASYYNEKSLLKNRFHPVSNGIFLKNFSGKKLKLKKPVLLFVGRFEPVKNIDTIITASAEVFKQFDAKLMLVGEGSMEEKLKKLVKKLNIEEKVIFTGQLTESQVAKMYKKATLFLIASKVETLGLSVLEAAASGLPIISSNRGALPELVKNGKNGYLFDINKSGEFEQKLIKILSNKKLIKQMGKESIEIASKHDIFGVARKFQSLYQKAIAINLAKQRSIKVAPFYLNRNFAIKVSLAILVMGILFRNTLQSPSTARAKNLAFKNKIMNLKIVKKIENLDLKLNVYKLKPNERPSK